MTQIPMRCWLHVDIAHQMLQPVMKKNSMESLSRNKIVERHQRLLNHLVQDLGMPHTEHLWAGNHLQAVARR